MSRPATRAGSGDRPRGLLIREAEVRGEGRVDVRISGVRISELARRLVPRADEEVVDAAGAALLPGLHDHHLHVLAAAAARDSVPCGPPAVRSRSELAQRLHQATPRAGWLRGVGYDDASMGQLDSASLDALSPPGVAVRISHRGGSLWVLNSLAAARLDLDGHDIAGVERDADGHATGRLWRLDGWLRERLGPDHPGLPGLPDLAGLSAELAAYGVTGVTDATPDLDGDAVHTIVGGGFEQRLVSLGLEHCVPGVGLGPRKLVVPDHVLPRLDDLTERIRAERPRAVALHCVTPAALVLALSALGEAGPHPSDRIEHAAITSPEATDWLAGLGVTVVTQPSMVALRGDDYLDRVEPSDRNGLWPFGSLLRAGVRVGCASDAPYGDLDPWAGIAAAVRRRAPSGRPVAPHEAVPAWQALRSYLTAPGDPGGPVRRVAVGASSDLVLLDRSLAAALAHPEEVVVRRTVLAGPADHRAPTSARCGK